ncbi:uncharacterized protein LOC124848456 [Vigna umbellata]|uniref:uncharacterized protein LOC124848456 n=1 Tax=Vigna umbellata TaxID=87088 RepID=UPI001F5E9C07|nr:uncharacterized protein LOC124848456 [Vigna umbellata]
MPNQRARTYSSESYSPNSQSESSYLPSSARKRLIPDSRVLHTRRSLRLANKYIETRTTPVQANQVSRSTVIYAGCSSMRSEQQEIVETGTTAEKNTEVSDNEKQMVNHSTQVEKHNALEVECAPLEKELLAEGTQTSANSRERKDKNNSRSISMVAHSSSQFSIQFTHIVNMWENEGDDEVDSVGHSSTMDGVEGYKVKEEFMPLLRSILTKHRDIFENSLILTERFRSVFLETICEIISELKDKDLIKITEDRLHSMIALANEMKNMQVNIEWLHLRLEEIYEARKILKQSGMLKERKDSNKKVIETVQRELDQCQEEREALEAKFQALRERICNKETACKETLARAQDEYACISQTITDAKSKVKRFLNCSLVNGLL